MQAAAQSSLLRSLEIVYLLTGHSEKRVSEHCYGLIIARSEVPMGDRLRFPAGVQKTRL